MFTLLKEVFDRSDDECDIDIFFKPDDQGQQINPTRDLVIQYLQQANISRARLIAQRLESCTDRRSGLGLLFLIAGAEKHEHKVVISRFPTDSAILVDENNQNFNVQFLERVFMKNKTSYKAVAYRGASFHGDFWNGRAIDKQIGYASETSNYWIEDFLYSDFLITPQAGTRRLATALREAAKKSDLDVKNEIVSAATLAGRLGTSQISISDFEERFALSAEARRAINDELKSPEHADERFRFDVNEFREVVAYRSVELSNGGVLTAPAGQFDTVFERRVVNRERNEVRYSTQGTVVGQRIGKSK